MYHPVLWAAFGTGITCLSTVLGSATVLFVRVRLPPPFSGCFWGFAAGVMVGRLSIQPAPARYRGGGGRWRGWVAPSSRRLYSGGAVPVGTRLPSPPPTSGVRRSRGSPFLLAADHLMVLAVTLHNTHREWR